ncbi:hypothetical protein ACRAWF_36745 [Streptomyces sp. L7]
MEADRSRALLRGALKENSQAAKSVLDAYQDWVNKPNEKGLPT